MRRWAYRRVWLVAQWAMLRMNRLARWAYWRQLPKPVRRDVGMIRKGRP